MRVVHIIHGIHTANPFANVGRLKGYFEQKGYRVKVHRYGYLFALLARWRNPKIAKKIAKQVDTQDIVVGHSNGGTLAWMISQQKRFTGAILINPALDRDRVLPGAGWIHVYHTPEDRVVWWSKFLPHHPWGEMGRRGYLGPSKKYWNINMARTKPFIKNHVNVFKWENLRVWGRTIVERLDMELAKCVKS